MKPSNSSMQSFLLWSLGILLMTGGIASFLRTKPQPSSSSSTDPMSTTNESPDIIINKYSFALQYALASEDATCNSNVQEKLHEVTLHALKAANMNIHQAKSSVWLQLSEEGNGKFEHNIVVQEGEEDHQNKDDLDRCCSLCKNNQAIWCDCWPHFTTQSIHKGGCRMLRSGEPASIDKRDSIFSSTAAALEAPLPFEEIVPLIRADALEQLNVWHHHIKCLADPYAVKVLLIKDD